jgi:hypothetical protein
MENEVDIDSSLWRNSMDRICEWRDVWKEDLERVEDPFFACSVVQRALLENTTLRGLCDFQKACDLPLGRPLLQDDIWRALKLVEDGRNQSWIYCCLRVNTQKLMALASGKHLVLIQIYCGLGWRWPQTF